MALSKLSGDEQCIIFSKLCNDTEITDAGCATLAAALDSGALPALEVLDLYGIPASAAAYAAVYAARANLERFCAQLIEEDLLLVPIQVEI